VLWSLPMFPSMIPVAMYLRSESFRSARTDFRFVLPRNQSGSLRHRRPVAFVAFSLRYALHQSWRTTTRSTRLRHPQSAIKKRTEIIIGIRISSSVHCQSLVGALLHIFPGGAPATMQPQQQYRGYAQHVPPRAAGQHVPQRRGGIGKWRYTLVFPSHESKSDSLPSYPGHGRNLTTHDSDALRFLLAPVPPSTRTPGIGGWSFVPCASSRRNRTAKATYSVPCPLHKYY
jgi:hypothetical protein